MASHNSIAMEQLDEQLYTIAWQMASHYSIAMEIHDTQLFEVARRLEYHLPFCIKKGHDSCHLLSRNNSRAFALLRSNR